MFIIVGLGNPKRKYENTRHNVGFMCIDEIAKEYNIDVIECKNKALIGKGYIGTNKVILVKPQTFMNLSGESVREIVNYYKVDEKTQLVVIYDDVSMPLGQLRIRKKGSAGGHNGIKNIILHLGHDTFLRIKVGIGEKPDGYDLADYVLGHFNTEEKKIMDDDTKKVCKAIELIIEDKIDAAMNQFN